MMPVFFFICVCFSDCRGDESNLRVLQYGINLSSACVSAFTMPDVCDVQLFGAENISSNDS